MGKLRDDFLTDRVYNNNVESCRNVALVIHILRWHIHITSNTFKSWQLGPHTLICADSTNKDTIFEAIGGDSVDMIMTDPPYNMQYSGGGCFINSTSNITKRLQKLINFDPECIRFITEMDILSVYIFTSKALLRPYLNIFKDYNQNVLVWCKTNPVPFTGGTFLPDVEYLLFFSKRGKVWNNSLKPMYTYSKYHVSKKEQGKSEAGNVHPTIKPLQFIEDKIRISSKPKGVVLDMFGGSGTTLIACEHTGRRCIMFEYEEEYCDVIVNRWESETGERAYKLS